MLDRDALDLIQTTAIQAAEIKSVMDGRALVVPEGSGLISSEPHALGRHRFRGNYTTTALGDFTAYAHARRAEYVFVDADTDSATAFFNLGDRDNPGHGDDRAHLNLKQTNGYRALLNIDGRTLAQRTLAEFIEDWFDFIVPVYSHPDSDEPKRGTVTAALTAIRDITVTANAETNSVDRDLAVKGSTFASVEAKSRHQLPAGFEFTVEPYDGFESRTFRLRLSVASTPENKTPLLAVRIVGLSDVQEHIAIEFEQRIRRGLADTSALVYRGKFTP